MKEYLAKRILTMIPILFGISLFVFLMLHLIPGDPASVMLGEHASPQAINMLRNELGLSKPLYVQFFLFLKGTATLHFGRSIQTNNGAFQEVLTRFPATIELAFCSMLIAILIGIPLGFLGALHQNKWIDYFTGTVSLIGISMPIFWLGLLFILLFASYCHLFPFSGRIFVGCVFPTPTHFYLLDSLLTGNFEYIKDVMAHLFLPAITLSTIPLAIIARTTRGTLLEVFHEAYMKTAIAKGLSPQKALWKHGLKNAMISILTITGLQFGYLLGGAVLTETVFEWPGLGRLVVEAVKARDYPVVQATVFTIALTFVLINTLVDLSYSYLDPRINPLNLS